MNLEFEKDERNDAARAFRKFARLGLNDASTNPAQAYKRIDVLCHARRTKLDMLAVYDTLRLLSLVGDVDTLAAIWEVYFSLEDYRFSKSETARRVRKCAQNNYCDERTVYRRLVKARSLYTRLREKEGLLWEDEK